MTTNVRGNRDILHKTFTTLLWFKYNGNVLIKFEATRRNLYVKCILAFVVTLMSKI